MFKKQILSFDFGTCNTKVVLGKRNNNGVTVKDAFSFETPEGTIEDGQILNLGLLKEEILKNLDERNIFTNSAVFSLASTKAIVREVTLPYPNEKKMAAMVPYEMSKQLPISADNYVIDHVTLDVFKEENIKKARILAIAIPKQIVKAYWNLCSGLEIEPIALTLHGIEAGNFFTDKSVVTGQMETIALLDIGYASINCNIISGGKLVFNRIISTVGMKTRPEKLENIDKKLSPVNYDKYVRETMDKWLEEIKLVFRFYFSLSGRSEIEKIVLIGGATSIQDIAPYFEEKLEKQTFILENKPRISYKGKSDDFQLNHYFNAVCALKLS